MARRTPYNMLLMPPVLERISPRETALLLLDAHHYATARERGLGAVASERGIMREFEEYFRLVDAALPNMARLVAAARKHGVTIVHSILSARQPVSRQLATAQLPLPAGDPAAEIRPEVAPREGEIVLTRGAYGCFLDGALQAQLAARGIRRLIICGMLANITVVMAAREAADRDYWVIVVHDASASEALDWHTVSMLGVGGGLVRVQMTDDVIEMMEGTRT
jgi:nicotinamidase-related amidase